MMAVIGFVRQEKIEVNDNGNKKEVSWLEAYFRVAGLRPFKAKLGKNKNKQNDNAPDYYLYLRGNINKGDTFRDIKIGSFWIKNKELDGGRIETYMTGNVEIAFKEVRCLIKKPKKYFEDEKIGFLYEIIAFLDETPQKQVNGNDEYANEYQEQNYERTYAEIDEDNIPF